MRRIALSSLTALVIVTACGGSDSSSVTGTNGNLTGPMTALIDGKAWAGSVPTASYKNNILAIASLDISSGLLLEIGSAGVTGPGTYSLAFANLNAGTAIITQGSQAWGNSVQGATGSLVVTTLTANHVVATFSFDAPASNKSTTGTKHVTNGKIDTTF